MVGGRPLTMHEAVLPQSACEMLADRDWAIPKSGGRPWLDRPPLPQWITVATAMVLGSCAQEWIVRLPPVLIATGVVFLLARMAAGWFGQSIGVLSGLVLATMFEFTRYAWLAEPDMFLCGLVISTIALFVQLEFFQNGVPDHQKPSFLGKRSLLMLAFFVLLGMTNLAKGLLFGTVMALVPIAGFLLWNASRDQIARYIWGWGWLVFVLIAMAWPLAAWSRYPDVIKVWGVDHIGRLTGSYTAINQPFWYYPVTLAWVAAPWTLPALIGLVSTRTKAFHIPFSAERFLWCWAILPIAIFSFASGKHHHYLLQCLAPWAVLAALGLLWLRDRIVHFPSWRRATILSLWILGFLGAMAIGGFSRGMPGPAWLPWALLGGCILLVGSLSWAISQGNDRAAIALLLGAIVALYGSGYTYTARISHQSIEDTVFLKQVPTKIRAGVPVMANADLGSMELFRILFYLHGLGEQVVPIHNLTFLLDDRIWSEEVYVITRQRDITKLTKLGTPEILLQSLRSRRERAPDERFTLFHLRFHKDLHRRPVPSYISPMQAMDREEGPFIGSPL